MTGPKIDSPKNENEFDFRNFRANDGIFSIKNSSGDQCSHYLVEGQERGRLQTHLRTPNRGWRDMSFEISKRNAELEGKVNKRLPAAGFDFFDAGLGEFSSDRRRLKNALSSC